LAQPLSFFFKKCALPLPHHYRMVEFRGMGAAGKAIILPLRGIIPVTEWQVVFCAANFIIAAQNNLPQLYGWGKRTPKSHVFFKIPFDD
jgi:hypothetical protein